MIEREHGAPIRTKAVGPTAAPPVTSAEAPHARILSLQRLAGNRAVVGLLRQAQGAGSAVPSGVLRSVEASTGVGLGDARVHRSSPVPELLGAEAFARGSEIHLAPGAEHHLPHELAHVAQQRQGRVEADGRLLGLDVSRNVALEQEADRGGVAGAEVARSTSSVLQGVFRRTGQDQDGTDVYLDDETQEFYVVEAGSADGSRLTLRGTGFNRRARVDVRWDAAAGGYVDDGPGAEDTAPERTGGATGGAAMDYTEQADDQLRAEGMRLARLGSDVACQVDVVPLSDGSRSDDGYRTYVMGDVLVTEIMLGNDRPPTYLEPARGKSNIPQGDHTVAFALVRRSLGALAPRPVDVVVGALAEQLYGAERFLGTEEGKFVAARLGPVVDGARQALGGLPGGEVAIDVWQAIVSDLVAHYVELYHLSAMSTIRGHSGGRGESHALQSLQELEEHLEAGGHMPALHPDQVAAMAVALIQVNQRMEAETYVAAIEHWEATLTTTFPLVMAQFRDAVVKEVEKQVLGVRYQREMDGPGTVGDLRGAVGGGPAAALPPREPRYRPPGVVAAPPGLEHPAFVAAISLQAMSAGEIGAVGSPAHDGGVEASSLSMDEVLVRRIRVSDARPDTQFGTAQKSHTVPWSSLRIELGTFADRPLRDLVSYVGSELEHLRGDVDPHTAGLLEGTHALLTQALETRAPIHVWQSNISRAVQWYVYAHQAARSTTYSDPRTLGAALGHGEATHQAVLDRAERALGDEDVPAPDVARLTTAVLALLDLSGHLPDEVIRRAYQRWKRMLERAYPRLWANFSGHFTAAAGAMNIGTPDAPVALGSRLPAL